MIPKQLLAEASQLQETLVFNRRYLHSHAETGFDLHDTIAFVKKTLRDMGYEPTECGKAGLVALAGGKRKGKFSSFGPIWMHCQSGKSQKLVFPLKMEGCMHADMTCIRLCC